jgi:uncharacterized protein DUF4160
MFVEVGGRHNRPHFHAYYEGKVATYAIDRRIEGLQGSLPIRQERLITAWAKIHRDELLENWNELQAGRPPTRIEPLR